MIWHIILMISVCNWDVILTSWTSPWQILNKHTIVYMLCSIWTSYHISHLRLSLGCDIALRNTFSQSKSTIVYMFNIRFVLYLTCQLFMHFLSKSRNFIKKNRASFYILNLSLLNFPFFLIKMENWAMINSIYKKMLYL